MQNNLENQNVVQMPSALPPQSVESEIAILGAVLASPTCINRISSLNPEDFYVPVHSLIFDAMRRVHQKGNPADKFHVLDVLSGKKGEKEAKDAIAALDKGEGALYVYSVDKLSALIKEKSKQRKLVAIASRLSQEVMGGMSSEDAIADCQQQLLQLKLDGGKSQTIRFIDAAINAYEELEAANAGEDAVEQGIPTGFYDIDEIISCLPFGSLSVLGGRGGMGKTTFALDIALRTAASGLNTVFFALEMTSAQMAKKSLARLAAPKVPASLMFRKNALNENHWLAISDVMTKASDLPLWVNDTSRITPTEIRAELQGILAAENNISLVVVDYVQLVKLDRTRRNGTRTEEIYEVLQELRAIAKDFDCAVLGLSQLKREIDSRSGDKRPLLSDFGDSSAFDREAATALAIYRDEYYNPESTDKGIAEILVLKNRFGEQGKAKLIFDSSCGEFKNMARGRW